MKGITLFLASLASLEPAYSLPGWGRLARNANDLKKVEAEMERAGKGRRWGSRPWGTSGSNSTYGTGLTTGTGGTGVAGPTGFTSSGPYIGDGMGGSAGEYADDFSRHLNIITDDFLLSSSNHRDRQHSFDRLHHCISYGFLRQ